MQGIATRRPFLAARGMRKGLLAACISGNGDDDDGATSASMESLDSIEFDRVPETRLGERPQRSTR